MELRKYFAVLLFITCLSVSMSQLAYEDHFQAINRLMVQTDRHKNLQNKLAQNLMQGNKGSLLAVLESMPQLKEEDGMSLKFEPSTGSKTSLKVQGQCLADVIAFARHLNPAMLTEWAVRMADATGKPSAGILSARFLFLGDFDECRAVQANYTSYVPIFEKRTFMGQFCTARYRVNFPPIPAEGNYHWGLCIPDSCTDVDAVQLGNYALSQYNISIVQFESATCHLQSVPWTASAIGVASMIGVIIFFVLVGTAVDIMFIQWPKWRNNEFQEDLGGSLDHFPVFNPFFMSGRRDDVHSHRDEDSDPLIVNGNRNPETVTEIADNQPHLLVQILSAFSLWTNAEKLLSTKQPPGALSCVNGLRVISINWVVLGHTFLILTTVGDNIGAYSEKALNRWSFQAIINGTYSVDTFFVLSGLLVTYLTLGEMRRNAGKVNWVMFYVHRYLRLTPVYMICLGIWVTLLPYTVDGPLFPQKTGFENDHCKNSWWGNLLYVQNLVKFKPTYCFQWAWYLAVDMQFYVLSPLIIIPLYRRRRLGYFIMSLFLVITTVTPFILSEIRYYPAAGVKAKGYPQPRGDKNYDLYISPYCRMGPYLAGMLCGYALCRIDGRRVRMHWIFVALGWAVSTAVALAVLYGLKDYYNGHEMNLHLGAVYNALSRTAWGVSVAWVIFCCVTGHGGLVNTFLSWSFWVPLSRLTYVVYLIHIIVLAFWGVMERSPYYIDDIPVVIMYLATLMGTYAVAFVFSLLFESPVMALEKVFFKKNKRS